MNRKAEKSGAAPHAHTDMHALALVSIKDIGPKSIKKLIGVFGSAKAVFSASERALSEIVQSRRARAIKEFQGWDLLEKEMKTLRASGVRLISYGDAEYPAYLKEIPDSPPVLYTRGKFVEEDRYAVAIVGTRMPTQYGVLQAENISYELARMGFTIVSGFARGIDTAAHRGALKAGGRTIAVMGSGIDVPYPPENLSLVEKIAASGAVTTEFSPGTPPNRENFPKRNRIISGLSLGVLVVEAAKDSGSLITAGLALEQGKEIFSIPGNVTSVNSKGTNELIKKGAKMVLGANDILEELAPVLKGFLKKSVKKNVKLPELSHEEKNLIRALGPEPRHIDEIARELNLNAQKILSILLSLELKGVVRQAAGKKFFIC